MNPVTFSSLFVLLQLLQAYFIAVKTHRFSKETCFFAGICTMIAISWYAANITQQFFDQYYPGTK